MPVSVAIETPLQDDVHRLVAHLNAHLLPLSPPQFQFKMKVEQMADADTTVFVARLDDGAAVGIGALKAHDGGLGEIKRMFTDPAVRGQRIGVALLDAIMALARDKAMSRLMLETGIGPGFEGAHRLYARRGFAPRGAFHDYPESDWSAFYEMTLAAPAGAA